MQVSERISQNAVSAFLQRNSMDYMSQTLHHLFGNTAYFVPFPGFRSALDGARTLTAGGCSSDRKSEGRCVFLRHCSAGNHPEERALWALLGGGERSVPSSTLSEEKTLGWRRLRAPGSKC